MMKPIQLLSGILLMAALTACGGGQSSPEATAPAQDTLSNAEEDDVLLRLSALMTTDTTREARERNAILDFAIEHLLDVEEDSTGLFLQIVTPGAGAPVEWADYLKVHYVGKFLDNRTFADTYAEQQPLVQYVGNFMEGWNIALQRLHVGGRMRVLVPSHLAYGAEGVYTKHGQTVVPPHTPLYFEVEIVEKLKKED